MEVLRNPFAVRNGKMILIEDLTVNERGLKCQCKCPSCDGDFIARMGDVKVHHFAHSKDACDDVIAYTSGLYMLIHQILNSGSPFYVPPLVVAYSLPNGTALSESNINSYVQIVSEHNTAKYKEVISPGRLIVFESAELSCDSKNHIQAIELVYKSSKIAIKVMPPDTVCKYATVSAHKDMATLVVDFTNDANAIQTSNSETFKNYLLSQNLDKWWVHNPKIHTVFPKIIAQSKIAFQEYQEKQKQLEEERKIAVAQYQKKQEILTQQISAEREEQNRILHVKKEIERNAELERQRELRNNGYLQVKDNSFSEPNQIRDSYGLRWIQCEVCGEIKPEDEFGSYQYSRGKCKECYRTRDGSEQQ